jgi:hypothetical protein
MFRAFCVRPRDRAATIADSDGHCLPQWLSSGPSGVFQHIGRSASPLGKATQPLNRFDGQVNIQCWKKSRQRTTAPACDADHAPGIAPPHKGDRWVAQRPARSADTDRSHPPSGRVCARSPGQRRIEAQSAVELIRIVHPSSGHRRAAQERATSPAAFTPTNQLASMPAAARRRWAGGSFAGRRRPS